MKFILCSIIAAAFAALAVRAADVGSEPVLAATDDGRGVIVAASPASPSRGTFSTYHTTDRSRRLAELREINKPPPAPPAPSTVVIVEQNVTTNVRIDRARHDRRMRRPRHYSPSPLP